MTSTRPEAPFIPSTPPLALCPITASRPLPVPLTSINRPAAEACHASLAGSRLTLKTDPLACFFKLKPIDFRRYQPYYEAPHWRTPGETSTLRYQLPTSPKNQHHAAPRLDHFTWTPGTQSPGAGHRRTAHYRITSPPRCRLTVLHTHTTHPKAPSRCSRLSPSPNVAR
jgi:hypothetical protein